MCITVCSKRSHKGVGVYIGRPSALGNPFAIGRDGSREQVIEKYETWLRDQWVARGAARSELIRLARQYKETGSLNLVCWCAPLPCHGDVLARAIKLIAAKL